MTRLLIPLVLALLGLLIGYGMHCVRDRPEQPALPLLVAGAAGAFAGLFIRDLFDIEWGGDLGGSLLAAVIGATALSFLASRLR